MARDLIECRCCHRCRSPFLVRRDRADITDIAHREVCAGAAAEVARTLARLREKGADPEDIACLEETLGVFQREAGRP